MINKEKFRTKAQFIILLNNPVLKNGVFDNDMFMDFSSK